MPTLALLLLAASPVLASSGMSGDKPAADADKTYEIKSSLPVSADSKGDPFISISKDKPGKPAKGKDAEPKPDKGLFSKEVTFTVKNLSDKEQVFNIKGLNALTTPAGEIIYTAKTELTNKDNQVTAEFANEEYQFTDYVSVPGKATIKAGDEVEVDVALDVPNDVSATGTIVGAVSFELDGAEQPDVYGVVLNVSEATTTMIDVERPVARPDDAGGYTLHLPVTQADGMILRDVAFDYTIREKESKAVVVSSDMLQAKRYDFTPGTLTELAVDWVLDKPEKEPNPHPEDKDAEKDAPVVNELDSEKDYVMQGKFAYTTIHGERVEFTFESPLVFEGEAQVSVNGFLVGASFIPFGLVLLLFMRSRRKAKPEAAGYAPLVSESKTDEPKIVRSTRKPK